MIEVNLLPGGKKRPAKSRGVSFSMPDLGGLGVLSDRWVLSAVVAAVLGFGGAGWLWYTSQQTKDEVQVDLNQAVEDSARFADIIERTELLQARQDSINERVAVIQDIDEGRYVWPHVLDEVARALPDYTWLRGLSYTARGETVSFRISGQAGNNFAMALFMEQLEESPFLQNVQLIQSQQSTLQIPGSLPQLVVTFDLELEYVQPPLEFLETVPLFGSEPAESAPDTTGTEPPDSAR